MYENFDLCKIKDGKIVGYKWDADQPIMTVCIIHGIGEYAARYERVAEAFNRNGIAVVSMDLRGHGLSAGKRGHCAPRKDVLRDVDILIEYAGDLHPNVPIALYGHSLGGNIVLDYRARGEFNDKLIGYISTAPWLRLYSQPSGIFNFYVRAMEKINHKKTISSDVDEADLGNPKSVGKYNEDPMVHNKISAQCAVESFDIGNAMSGGTYEEDKKVCEIPLLLMQGTADKICDIQGARGYKEHHDNCEYVEWEGLYHEIHNGGINSEGDEVIEKMITFLKGLLD